MRLPSPDDVADLLHAIRLTPAETTARLEQAIDVSYWRRLCPAASVEQPVEFASTAADHRAVAGALRTLQSDGIFRLPPVMPPSSLAILNGAIDAVVDAG